MTRPSADRGADSTLEHWAGLAAIATGIGGLVYAVAFLGGVVLGANPSLGMLAASIALMLGGVLSLVVLVAVYRRVSAVSHGVALVGLLVLAAEARRSRALSQRVSNLGVVLGLMLVVVYLGRLIVLAPTNLLVAVPAGITGVILAPLFYIWLGLELRGR